VTARLLPEMRSKATDVSEEPEMVKGQEFAVFEKELIRREKSDLRRNLQFVEALFQEAVDLGVFPLKDPLEGLEVDIRIAKVVNSVQTAP